jgi:hypothetical protein
MALSDCARCWNTPCTCGYDYRSWSKEELSDLITNLSLVLAVKLADMTWCAECDQPMQANDKTNLCPVCIEKLKID